MKTGWDRWDRALLTISAGLIVWGAIQIPLWGSVVIGLLLICEGLLIGAHRYHLRIVHNNAWIMGRGAMLASLSEAMRRGMHPIDFVIAEAERDGARVRIVTEGPEE